MTVFTQLKALGWTPQDFKRKKGATQEEIKREIFDALVAAHEDQSKGTEYYIPEHSYDANDTIIWGGANKKDFILKAQSWNKNIQKEFLRASGNLIGLVNIVEGINPEEIPMDNTDTWRMQCAARELNNSWWGDANHAVYAENSSGYPYFSVLLSEEMKEDIIQHPENWVLADLTVK